MPSAKARQTAARLEQALDEVQEFLMRGKLSELAAATAEICALLPMVQGLDDLALGRRLQAKAIRNEACLAAATRGVRAARRRIAEVASAETGLSTYDGDGRRAAIRPHNGRLEQRL